MTTPHFWATTWSQLCPGDQVQAPDASVWTVCAAITRDGDGEWCLMHPLNGRLWTAQRGDASVRAARPSAPGGDERAALMALTRVFGDLELNP